MTAPFTGPEKSSEVLTGAAHSGVRRTLRRLMHAKLSLAAFAPALVLALCPCPLRLGVAAEDAKLAAGPSVQAIDAQNLAKVVPGISKGQVKSLLGNPWRTVQYNDLDQTENEFWEYRGKDARGTYRVHVEFDQHGTVVIVGKIPDKVAAGKGTPAKN
jgi:outer membrane protein assembly factor BamE (lipoprotein component of BamABCDE complex)